MQGPVFRLFVSIMTRWQKLLGHWEKDLRLWLYITATLIAFRLILLITYHELIATSSTAVDILQVLIHGLRFDLSTAGSLLIITILLSLFDWGKLSSNILNALRLLIIAVYIPVTAILFVADLIFFAYFGQQFDARISGLWQDNTQDLLLTFWKDSHPILYLLAFASFIYLNYRLFMRWYSHKELQLLKHPSHIRHGYAKAVFALFFIFLISALTRGSLSDLPLSRRHAYVTNDPFLNQSVMNPHATIRYVLHDMFATASASTLKNYWPDGIDSAIKTAYPQNAPLSNKISELMLRKSSGLGKTKPRHIVLIVMESYSGWPLLDKYQHIGLSSQLQKLADNGIYLQRYLPDSASTIGNLATLITSYPNNGLKLNLETGSLKAYETSIAAQFKQLGYTTRLFYGGGLPWMRIGEFANNQGFSEVYGFNNMQQDAETMNGWKVHDEYIYRYVESKLDDKPSLNVILTTSNHPPFEIDWQKRGYPATALPKSITQLNSDAIHKLGAFWYADQAMGNFVSRVEQNYGDSLFVITGDHRARLGLHFKERQDRLANHIVPLVIYGPQVLDGLKVDSSVAASHVNVSASIMEVVFPKGTPYHSAAPSIFHLDRNSYAINNQVMINDVAIPALNPSNKLKPEQITALAQRRALSALVWQRVRVGNELVQPGGQ